MLPYAPVLFRHRTPTSTSMGLFQGLCPVAVPLIKTCTLRIVIAVSISFIAFEFDKSKGSFQSDPAATPTCSHRPVLPVQKKLRKWLSYPLPFVHYTTPAMPPELPLTLPSRFHPDRITVSLVSTSNALSASSRLNLFIFPFQQIAQQTIPAPIKSTRQRPISLLLLASHSPRPSSRTATNHPFPSGPIPSVYTCIFPIRVCIIPRHIASSAITPGERASHPRKSAATHTKAWHAT